MRSDIGIQHQRTSPKQDEHSIISALINSCAAVCLSCFAAAVIAEEKAIANVAKASVFSEEQHVISQMTARMEGLHKFSDSKAMENSRSAIYHGNIADHPADWPALLEAAKLKLEIAQAKKIEADRLRQIAQTEAVIESKAAKPKVKRLFSRLFKKKEKGISQ